MLEEESPVVQDELADVACCGIYPYSDSGLFSEEEKPAYIIMSVSLLGPRDDGNDSRLVSQTSRKEPARAIQTPPSSPQAGPYQRSCQPSPTF